MTVTETLNIMSKVVELAYRKRSKFTLSDMAKQCKITEEEMIPIFSQLIENGWIGFDSTKKIYKYGLGLLLFAREERLRAELVRQCEQVMRNLSRVCNQTVMLNAIEGLSAVCIYKTEPEKAVHIAARVGRESPLHAGSSSRVLLAYAPEAVKNSIFAMPLVRYTPYTIISVEKLKESLEEIRLKGYACSVEEIDPGASAVSAAILDGSDNLIASLSVVGTRFAFETEGPFWRTSLLEAIEEIKNILKGQVN